MSEKTELSVSFLPQFERGISSITLVSLKKIAEALNITMKELFEDESDVQGQFVHKKDSGSGLLGLKKKYASYERLSGKFEGRKLESLLLRMELLREDFEACTHEGEEQKGCKDCTDYDKGIPLERDPELVAWDVKNEYISVRQDGVAMSDFSGACCPTDGKVSMGYAIFPPETVVPPASHTGDEYSYIISGKVKCECNGKSNELCAGEASFIPAGEVHSSMNDSDEDATLVWMLIEKE